MAVSVPAIQTSHPPSHLKKHIFRAVTIITQHLTRADSWPAWIPSGGPETCSNATFCNPIQPDCTGNTDPRFLLDFYFLPCRTQTKPDENVTQWNDGQKMHQTPLVKAENNKRILCELSWIWPGSRRARGYIDRTDLRSNPPPTPPVLPHAPT